MSIDSQLDPEMTEEVQLYLLRQDILQLRSEIIHLREDVTPVIEFYTRIQTLGWVGKALIWLIGALIAIAVGAVTLAKSLRP